MKYLFVPNNMKLLESLAFTDTLYAFDFDGTLSKIVQIPGSARLSPKTKKLLASLSKVADVAVISGRSLKDLKHRIGIEGPIMIGNHGIEGFDIRNEQLEEINRICKRWHSKLLKTWVNKTRDPYIELEFKEYSLSLHYRRSRKKKQAQMLAIKAIEELRPRPRVIWGKSVINIMPADSPYKGNTIVQLLEKSRASKVFYIGDDDTDETVFEMADLKVLSVRVGLNRNSKAMFFIKNQSEINKLLTSLIKINSFKKIKGQNHERRNNVK